MQSFVVLYVVAAVKVALDNRQFTVGVVVAGIDDSKTVDLPAGL